MQLSKEEYARKESIMVLWCKLKIPSLVKPNNYPRDGIFNQHLTTIKDPYIPQNNLDHLHRLQFAEI